MQTSPDFELPSGETINVRGLTGLEFALISKRNAALVNNPDAAGGIAIQVGLMLGKTRIMDAEEAGTAWMIEHDARDFSALSDEIERLSGYGQGAQKRSVDRASND